MRRTTRAVLALALLLGGVGPAAAQNNPLVTADENGHGTIQFPARGSVPTTGVIAPDVGPGGRPNALNYSLLGPPGLVTGDVFVHDPSGALTDLIRFQTAGQFGGEFVFYSQPGGTDLADLAGFPTANYSNTATALENAAGIISYTPTANQPGFVPGFGVSYSLTSLDPAPVPIPEPSSLVLFGMATAGCLGWRRWRTRRTPNPSAGEAA